MTGHVPQGGSDRCCSAATYGNGVSREFDQLAQSARRIPEEREERNSYTECFGPGDQQVVTAREVGTFVREDSFHSFLVQMANKSFGGDDNAGTPRHAEREWSVVGEPQRVR
ncbi:hypothetical protein SacazDRAFT_00519 [Saccharomonospora azurea NA-128]|uniref:Uncharacterized protein n=1 Tax=Saccharomonospora azurea NA-128 TaxID=882081 RepID=H8G994_9PSEU|nr:hypothetical protein SacazDRAFT_00519 [Saccharomonospora azurea NA-128]